MKTYDESGLSTAAVMFVIVGAVIGASLGLVTIGFPGAIASTVFGGFCGVVLADSLG